MTSSATSLIGLEELLPEPCDGTGEDAMSIRYRRKWHAGVHVGPDDSNDTGLQATEHTSFGAWVDNRREHDRKAQFLFALWQQSVRPVRPKPLKPLNRDSLASIASRAASKQLSRDARENAVVAVCTTNKQFHETVLRQMEACSYISIGRQSVMLDGRNFREAMFVDGELFATFCGLGKLVFPEVHFSDGGFAESIPPKLCGIERLFLPNGWRGYAEDDLKQLLEKNKGSLKVLKMDASLLSFLPDGLQLEEFSCTDPDEIPPVETKVFNCEYIRTNFSFPPSFIRTVSADEIRIKAGDIHKPDSIDTLAPGLANSRVKKLTITLPPIELTNLASLFQDVAATCPELECLELEQDSKLYNAGHDRLNVADQLAANIAGVMEERSAPFGICLKMSVIFVARTWPIARDFARRLLNEDLPPHEVVAESKEPVRLFRETSVGTKTIRVDCDIYVSQHSWAFGISH